MPDPLPEELHASLRASARRRGRFGEPTYFFNETTSTNDVMAALADQGAAEGTTVVALGQTAGRGRLGREWFSPAGAGLYASVLCRNQQAVPYLTLAGGVAVAEGIRRATGLHVVIKWPNDVLVSEHAGPDRRKLAGVLAEASSNAGAVQHVVLGFGINVRETAYPASIARRATSLESELGRAVDSGVVLAETLVALNETIGALACGDQADVLERWRRLSPSATGARVEWTAPGAACRGTTAGIDESGALLVRVGDRLERVRAGEVNWL
jgi:BirA family biotin operon repressor/biotin-[acetyl-CoA-carboxylase] ligase